jgi:hypothetical protein
MGAWERRDAEGLVGLFPLELEWRYGFRVGAIGGFALLRNQRMAIDFEAMRLSLE